MQQNTGCKLKSQALNGALQKKRMADLGLFIVACHHIDME
jgi:hypothetical protein